MPILGHTTSQAGEHRFRDGCDSLGRLLDHVAARTQMWDRAALSTWHVRDVRAFPKVPTPVREVFAPTQAEALEADSWWHFQAPLYTIPHRLPARTAQDVTQRQAA